jgi:uncharacterized protein YndB with AHSA1/START domain
MATTRRDRTLNTSPREEALRIEVTIGAPVEAVWQAMREPDQIRRWHGWHFDGLDEEIKLIYDTGAHEAERPYALIIEPDDLFELEQVEGGTRVRVIRSAPEPDSEWAAYFDDVTEGWISFLHQLRFMLERHPRDERRTVFFTGEGAAVSPSQLIADSPAADGEQFFTAENQRGVVVDDLGPGLLIVGAKPNGNGAMAILTTYGQDDRAFDETRARWNTWWADRYPDAPLPVS